MKNLILFLGLCALVCACTPRAPFYADFEVDGGDSDSDSDMDSDSDGDAGGDSGDADTDTDTDTDTATDTDTELVCNLNVLETFDVATLPINWVIEDLAVIGYTWNHLVVANTTGGSGGYWWVDSDIVDTLFDERLITSTYLSSDCSEVTLTFDHDFYHYDFDFAYVDIEVNGNAWQNVITYTTDSTGAIEIDITSFLNAQSSFKLRFHYTGHQDHYWKIDNVAIVGVL